MSDLLVLGYHAVSDDWPAGLSVTTKALDQQLAELVSRGYRGACFSAAISEPAQRPTVVVTFDDNYRSVLERAKPILDRYEIPGTLYVPSDWLDDARPMSWPGIDRWLGTPYEKELHSISSEELRGLVRAGWEIGSHTCSHARLTQLDDGQLEHELVSSKATIESKLGLPCTSLAYPYGDVDERVEACTREAGYLGAAALPRAPYTPRAFCWPRTAVYNKDKLWRFRAKVSPAARRARTFPAVNRLEQAVLR